MNFQAHERFEPIFLKIKIWQMKMPRTCVIENAVNNWLAIYMFLLIRDRDVALLMHDLFFKY